jgi:hypothetical protein
VTPHPRDRSWPHASLIRAQRRRCSPTTPDVYFTTPHFDGYPAILVRLDRIALTELEELLA